MKLISLHIENFGCLSDYNLSFSEGLTVIREDNGFGKTTLAEFIRAMFYGFPRAGKGLGHNRRKKYLPWNGSKCGGSLGFETEGKRYRVERTFGATPRADTFSLIDLATNKKSGRFTENLGVELFGLDGDSFERSTYMPQLREKGSLNTDNIRAKLGNLVEDTNDINNFDLAIQKLRTKRSSFVPYRGAGGSVAEARGRVSELQQDCDRAEEKRSTLVAVGEQILRENGELQSLKKDLSQIHARRKAAAEAEAIRQSHRILEEKYARLQQWEQKREELESRYPAGIPDGEAIEKTRKALEQLELLQKQQVAGPGEEAARAYLSAHRETFRDGVPGERALEEAENLCREEISLQTELRATEMTDEERTDLRKLEACFAWGIPEEERLDSLARQAEQIGKYRTAAESQTLSREDQINFEKLERYFTAGLPAEQDIEACRRKLGEAARLREENNRLITEEPAKPLEKKPEKGKNKALPVVILGVLAVACGIVLMVTKQLIPGGICLGAGLLALIGGIYLSLRQMVSQSLEEKTSVGINQKLQERIAENEGKCRAMEKEVRQFAGAYTSRPVLSDGLHEIGTFRTTFLELRDRRDWAEENREKLEAATAELQEQLTAALSPYGIREGEFGRAIVDLRMKRQRLLTLREREKTLTARKQEITLKLQMIRQQLEAFLEPYYGKLGETPAAELVTRLQRESGEYSRSLDRDLQCREAELARDRAMEICRETMREFSESFGLGPELNREKLTKIGEEGIALAQAGTAIREAQKEIGAYREANSEWLSRSVPETDEDDRALQQEDDRLQARQQELTEALAELRQQERRLRDAADEIPRIRDDLEQWQEKKEEDQRKSDLLDETIEMLKEAKESLSTAYLGPVRRQFARYLGRLMEERQEKILLDTDLDVHLERQGQARDLDYFSAGQADLVMLCMRFALVDALFGKEQPFVLLDDPFVNLDDNRTAKALALLHDISREKQILYLACNSSRI